jgi:hypothetical protein
MLSIQALVFALLFLIVGAVLLHDGISNSDPSQTLLTSGAAFLSLGLISTCMAAKNWGKLGHQREQKGRN